MVDEGDIGRRIVESVEPLVVEYRTHEGDVRPNFCVYYLFPERNMGIGRHFKIDVPSFFGGKNRRVYPFGESVHFMVERNFLDELMGHDVQGVYVNLMDGMSFNDYSHLVSGVHADDFFNRYEAFGQIGLGGLKKILEVSAKLKGSEYNASLLRKLGFGDLVEMLGVLGDEEPELEALFNSSESLLYDGEDIFGDGDGYIDFRRLADDPNKI